MQRTEVDTAREAHESETTHKTRKLPAFAALPRDNRGQHSLPLVFQGTILYITTVKLANAMCAKLLREAEEDEVVVGFDIEWLVSYKPGDVSKKIQS